MRVKFPDKFILWSKHFCFNISSTFPGIMDLFKQWSLQPLHAESNPNELKIMTLAGTMTHWEVQIKIATRCYTSLFPTGPFGNLLVTLRYIFSFLYLQRAFVSWNVKLFSAGSMKHNGAGEQYKTLPHSGGTLKRWLYCRQCLEQEDHYYNHYL